METLETKICNVETDLAAGKLDTGDLSKKYDTMRSGTIVRIKGRLETLEKVNIVLNHIKIQTNHYSFSLQQEIKLPTWKRL